MEGTAANSMNAAAKAVIARKIDFLMFDFMTLFLSLSKAFRGNLCFYKIFLCNLPFPGQPLG